MMLLCLSLILAVLQTSEAIEFAIWNSTTHHHARKGLLMVSVKHIWGPLCQKPFFGSSSIMSIGTGKLVCQDLGFDTVRRISNIKTAIASLPHLDLDFARNYPPTTKSVSCFSSRCSWEETTFCQSFGFYTYIECKCEKTHAVDDKGVRVIGNACVRCPSSDWVLDVETGLCTLTPPSSKAHEEELEKESENVEETSAEESNDSLQMILEKKKESPVEGGGLALNVAEDEIAVAVEDDIADLRLGEGDELQGDDETSSEGDMWESDEENERELKDRLQIVKAESSVSNNKTFLYEIVSGVISATLGILLTVFGIHKRHVIRAALSSRGNRRQERYRLQETRINFSHEDGVEDSSLIESKYVLPASSSRDSRL